MSQTLTGPPGPGENWEKLLSLFTLNGELSGLEGDFSLGLLFLTSGWAARDSRQRVGWDLRLTSSNNVITLRPLEAPLGILDNLVGGKVEGGSLTLGCSVSHSLGSPFWLSC